MKVQAPNDLEWKVTRLVLAEWMRPTKLHDPIDRYAGYRGRLTAAGLPTLLVGLVVSIVLLPFVPLVVLLRRRGLVAWTLQAVARPWGRRGPPMVLVYSVRGSSAAVERAQADLVAKLEHGDGAPDVVGAERIR